MQSDQNMATAIDAPTTAIPATVGVHETVTCPSCQATLTVDAAFCSRCGATQLLNPAGWGDVPSDPSRARSRRARTAIIATAVAVAIVAGCLAAWVMIPNRNDKQVEASTAALSSAVTGLTSAESTSDIRQVAVSTSGSAQDAEAFLEGVPLPDQSKELVALSHALTAIASLQEVSGEAPQSWEAAEPTLRDIAGDPAMPLQLQLAGAADNVDKVVGDYVETFDAWKTKNAEAVAARDDAVTEATSYQSRMQSLVNDYIRERGQLSAFMDRADAGEVSMRESADEFARAAGARRDIRDSMQALDVPASANGEHGRLITVISDGIDALESAQRGLDSATCFYGYCYPNDEPAYQSYRSESKRITTALDQALAAWTPAAQTAVNDAQAMKVPAKPEV